MAIGALLPHFTVSLAAVRPAPARWRMLALSLLAGGAMTAVAADSLGALAVAAIAGLPLLASAGVALSAVALAAARR